MECLKRDTDRSMELNTRYRHQHAVNGVLTKELRPNNEERYIYSTNSAGTAAHHPWTKTNEQIKIIYTRILNPPQKSPQIFYRQKC